MPDATSVDLSVLSPAMLDGVWARLLTEFATAKDACDYEAMAETHICISKVIEEYGRRADAFIAAHACQSVGRTPTA